jgi:hypothetical protein
MLDVETRYRPFSTLDWATVTLGHAPWPDHYRAEQAELVRSFDPKIRSWGGTVEVEAAMAKQHEDKDNDRGGSPGG